MNTRILQIAAAATLLLGAAGPLAASAQDAHKPSCSLDPSVPTIVEASSPYMPELAAASGREGEAKVRILLTASGTVEDATIATSSGYADFDREALLAARATRYGAAEAGCATIPGSYLVDVVFRASL